MLKIKKIEKIENKELVKVAGQWQLFESCSHDCINYVPGKLSKKIFPKYPAYYKSKWF